MWVPVFIASFKPDELPTNLALHLCMSWFEMLAVFVINIGVKGPWPNPFETRSFSHNSENGNILAIEVGTWFVIASGAFNFVPLLVFVFG